MTQLKARGFVLALGLAMAASAMAQEKSGGAPLLNGVWKVAEITLENQQGIRTNSDPQPGLFVFGDDYYSIAWIPRPEPRIAFSTPWQPTDEEIKSAYETVLFNTGTYELTDTTLTTRPVISKVPDLSGGHAVYQCRIEQDVLWLTMIDEYSVDGSQAPWVGNVRFPLKLIRIE